MRRYPDEAVINEAIVFVVLKDSSRRAAKQLNIPQSTLLHHIKKRLPGLNPELCLKALNILQNNKRRK